MQGIIWLGKLFFESAMECGESSLPAINDRLVKIVFHIMLVLSKSPSHFAIQHLDDVCACAPEGSQAVDMFHTVYKKTCEELGVNLADSIDSDKSFALRTDGQVLGVDYDSTKMTWHLKLDKISIILGIFAELTDEGEVTVSVLKRLSQKLIYI